MAKIEIDGREWFFDIDAPLDISIPLIFNGPQPNAYGVDPATSKPYRAGELVGDTRQGGSVNFEEYTFVPHCSGTHTECVGHITHERIAVRESLLDVFIPALLISAQPETIDNGDLIIQRNALTGIDTDGDSWASALIIRTLPNDLAKLTREYGEYTPPYISPDAMEFILEANFRHLLVDMPSVDRIFDNGKLVNHRLFWNVEPGSFELNSGSRKESTITEMIYVPEEIEDGEYLLNLQIAPFMADASPSRPILYKIS